MVARKPRRKSRRFERRREFPQESRQDVIERITVEKENSLSREIDSLRDR